MTPEVPLPEVGSRLIAARMRRGLSQGTVARRSGIAPSYLSRIETGKVQPTLRTALKILRALDAEPEEIMGPRTHVDRRIHGCPLTDEGHCLLDLMRHETEEERLKPGKFYTPREVRLIRRMAGWVRGV